MPPVGVPPVGLALMPFEVAEAGADGDELDDELALVGAGVDTVTLGVGVGVVVGVGVGQGLAVALTVLSVLSRLGVVVPVALVFAVAEAVVAELVAVALRS